MEQPSWYSKLCLQPKLRSYFRMSKIKYMGSFLLDEFIYLNLRNDFSFDISIEPITHVIIPKKNYVHGKLHIIQDIIDMCCLIITSMVKKLLIKQ